MAQNKKGKDEAKPARSAANKARRQERNDHRSAKMVERTQKLIGQHVRYRDKDHHHPLVGTVTDILRKGDEGYPEPHSRNNPDGSKRKYGAFVKIRTPDGDKTVSRHRVKLVRKEDK